MNVLNKLSSSELLLIFDALNGSLWTDGFAKKKQILYNVEDAISLDKLNQKWEIDKDKLLSTLSDLTDEEGEELASVVNQFWTKKIRMNMETIRKEILAEIGARGGRIGGKRSLETMTPEERSERAKKAVLIREIIKIDKKYYDLKDEEIEERKEELRGFEIEELEMYINNPHE